MSHDSVCSSVPDWMSVVDHLLDGIEALPLVWDVEGFEDVGEGRVVATHPADGSLQVEETLLLRRRQHTGTDKGDVSGAERYRQRR